MAATEITVQRLRLRSRSAVPGLLPNVEDALRVSSKPAALLNRFVLVRRLRLRVAAGASAQALALQLERAWQQLAAQAQPMEQASETAEAVWAPGLAVARQALLRRWLRGEDAKAWFWQRLISPHVDGAWPARAVALMLMADDEAPGPCTLAGARRQALQVRALLALVAEHRLAAQFIEAIADAQALAVLSLIEAADEDPQLAHRRLHNESPAPPAVTPRARLLELMTAMSACAEDALIERRVTSSTLPNAQQAEAKALAALPDEAAPAASRRPEGIATEAPAAQAIAKPEPHALLSNGLASPWSGLWLLLPMLLRHGLDDADDPLAAWAGAMRAACRHLHIPDDDVMRTALAGLDLPLVDDPHWLRTARLAAVHDAHLPLLRIARRRGAVWVSPERIDVEFPPASLDLRIRRAGFDINPGFVPWLGRIVHFHYPS